MTREEFTEKIKVVVREKFNLPEPESSTEVEAKSDDHFLMKKFPELREAIVNLLTDQYDSFLEDIEWVAPRPTTFRIVLKNGENFYLIYTGKSWIAQVEGKKYYLLNLPEEERATEAIARILRYGAPGSADAEAEVEADASASAPESGGGEEVDVDVEDDVTVEI